MYHRIQRTEQESPEISPVALNVLFLITVQRTPVPNTIVLTKLGKAAYFLDMSFIFPEIHSVSMGQE